MSIIEARLQLLDTIHLEVGSHESLERGACVMEVVSYVAGEPWSDHPECVSPILGAWLRSWNDRVGDERRQALKAYIPRLIGTNTCPADEETRRWMLRDWLVHEYAPARLRAVGLIAEAEQLEQLVAITGRQEWEQARDVIYAARDAARARRREARKRLEDAAAAADAAAVAVADADADAVAAAAAAADADAAADAAAAAAAVADADAVAAAVADAVADAAAAADAAAVAPDIYKQALEAAAKKSTWTDRWAAAYEILRPYYDQRYKGVFDDLQPSALALLDRLIAVSDHETLAV